MELKRLLMRSAGEEMMRCARDGSGGGMGTDSWCRMNKRDVLMNKPPTGLPMPDAFFYMMENSLFPIQLSLQNLFLDVGVISGQVLNDLLPITMFFFFSFTTINFWQLLSK